MFTLAIIYEVIQCKKKYIYIYIHNSFYNNKIKSLLKNLIFSCSGKLILKLFLH